MLFLYNFFAYKDNIEVSIPILTQDPIHKMEIEEFQQVWLRV